MKKTYINPVMDIVKVQTQQMLAVSTPFSGVEATKGANDEYDDARSFDFDDED